MRVVPVDDRARRRRPAGRGRRAAHHVRRPGFPQRPDPCAPRDRRRSRRRHPDVSYDVTIKVEHLLAHPDLLDRLAGTRCAFVTSAVEAFDDEVLAHLQKGHTADDARRAVAACRARGLALVPTFVAFTPWTTLAGHVAFLDDDSRARPRERRRAGPAGAAAAAAVRLARCWPTRTCSACAGVRPRRPRASMDSR